MLMIWSSLARNRSPEPLACVFFGRIEHLPDAASESQNQPFGTPQNACPNRKLSRPKRPILVKTVTSGRRKTAPDQCHAHFSRPTTIRSPMALACGRDAELSFWCEAVDCDHVRPDELVGNESIPI